MKGYCDICGTEIEVRMCCSGHECGCMGLPIDPPVCSNECYDKLMVQKAKKRQRAIADRIVLRIKNSKTVNHGLES